MGFKEAFTRGQEEEKNLLFDDEAFFYFAISMLTVIIIPIFYIVLKPLIVNVIFRSESKHFKRVQQGINDQKVLDQVKKEQRTKWLNKGYYFKVLILIFLLFLLHRSIEQLPNQDAIKGFDPYDILEIDATATDVQIKKAFKKMSLKLHPDKNPDDPQAAQKFIMLTKAYECLSDETMKETCKKYGNPDGPTAFQVGIALPSFLLHKENRAAFLAIIFLILLVLIPVLVLSALTSIGKFDDNGVQRSNFDLFEKCLNENLLIKSIPKIVASTYELSCLSCQRGEEEFLHKLTRGLIDEAETRSLPNFELTELLEQKKKKKQKKQFAVPKAVILLYAHHFGKAISPLSLTHYNLIVKTVPQIIQSMINYAKSFSNRMVVERYRRAGRLSTKFMGLRCISTLIEYSQLAIQGLWEKDPDIYQINFFKHEASKYMKRDRFPNFAELIKTPRDIRILPNWVPAEKRDEVMDEIDLFPRIKVSYQLKIEDDTIEEFTTDDILILNVQLTRENTPEGQEIPFAHSNSFTYLKEEAWHIILSINEDVFYQTKLQGAGRTQNAEWKIIPRSYFGDQTDIKLQLNVKSDCYRGLDQEIVIQFKLKTTKEVNRVVQYHEEDEKLDSELPFINRMLNPMIQKELEESDDDSEEEEKKQTKKSPTKINEEKPKPE